MINVEGLIGLEFVLTDDEEKSKQTNQGWGKLKIVGVVLDRIKQTGEGSVSVFCHEYDIFMIGDDKDLITINWLEFLYELHSKIYLLKH